MLGKIDLWVQVTCPRFSVDWDYHFSRPVSIPLFFDLKEAKSESGKIMDTNA